MHKPRLIIDTHQHLWDLRRQKLPWLEGAPAILKQNYGLPEYRMDTDGLAVKAVYMEVDIAAEERLQEVETVVQYIRNGELTRAAIVSGPIGEPGFDEYLGKIVGYTEVKGLRRVLHGGSTPPGHALHPVFLKDLQKLGKHRLSFDLCMRPQELEDAVRVAKECPDTRLILDHCGNADPRAFHQENSAGTAKHDANEWRKNIETLARLPNVICKISGVIAFLPPGWPVTRLAPIVNHCLDAFGPDRVIFGGDWPVCRLGGELRDWIAGLAEIMTARPVAEQDKLWFANAERMFELA